MLLLQAAACGRAGGQTGEETTEACKDTITALTLDGMSALGFSPNQVLANTGSSASAPVTWLSTNGFRYGPESGRSSIEFTLQPKGARFVASEARPSSTMALPLCTDRVEVDVAVTCATLAGALDERFDGVLLATAANDVWLSHSFDPRSLAGDFAIDPVTLGNRKFIRFTLQAHFQPDGLTGTLAAGIEDGGTGSSNSSVSLTEYPVACIGGSADAGLLCAP
jgi:hypothetical protein